MMTIGLIALDLDGTLLDSQKNLSERNRRALERCARMGKRTWKGQKDTLRYIKLSVFKIGRAHV